MAGIIRCDVTYLLLLLIFVSLIRKFNFKTLIFLSFDRLNSFLHHIVFENEFKTLLFCFDFSIQLIYQIGNLHTHYRMPNISLIKELLFKTAKGPH